MIFSTDPTNNLQNLIAKNKTKSISIYLVVVLCILLFLGSLPVIFINISSQSRGMVRSKTDNVPLSVLLNGRVSFIKIKNNDIVSKGDTLIKIVKDALETDKMLQDSLLNTNANLLNDLTNLLQSKTNNIKTSTAREDYYKYQSQKNELRRKISLTQITYDRYQKLYKRDVIARAEYEKYLYEYQFAKDGLQSYINQQKATWETQKRELEERVKNLDGSLSKIEIEKNNYVVIAPISGTIEHYIGLQVGSIAVIGQAIASISPADNLIVENTVSPNDIGLIHKNQMVKFQIDAFNYNQWGLLQGKVIDIDKNITIDGKNAFFKVRCSINSTIMKLKSGYKTHVTKGMTLTTRYIIANRSLFDLLFDKVDDWLNPKSIRK